MLCLKFLNRFSSLSLRHGNLNTESRMLFHSTSLMKSEISSSESSPSTSVADAVPSATRQLPLMTSRKFCHPVPEGQRPKQAWLESLATIENEKLDIVDLHPEVFSAFPRIDQLWANIDWQLKYKKIDYRHVNNRMEMRGGGRKPWPQKGTGRARHGSIRSPLFIGGFKEAKEENHGQILTYYRSGGKCFGPRGPRSFFYMLPKMIRVNGLCSALTVKYAQNDLHIVDSLELPSADPKYLEELIESRGWGLSVLFIDDTDVIPTNMALASEQIKSYNVMPLYGLNVYSMLKHETLVLTLPAVEKLEERLLSVKHNLEFREIQFEKLKKL